MSRESTNTFRGALRAVLADHDPSATDAASMREVARRAMQLLDQDLIAEAAVTHLARIARSEWNRQAPEPDSEVVFLAGSDLVLGSTTTEQRELLAVTSEQLAAGLAARAERLREYMPERDDATEPSLREVLAAERRAAGMVNLADAMDRALAPERMATRHAEGLAEIEAEAAGIDAEIELLRLMAESLADGGMLGAGWGRARRAVRQCVERFGLTYAEPEVMEEVEPA